MDRIHKTRQRTRQCKACGAFSACAQKCAFLQKNALFWRTKHAKPDVARPPTVFITKNQPFSG
ncbi:hypothetical protein ZK99_002349 [Salmonella enterica subsp. enterica]|uniref:Uncharacterized protein n=1 Tax=Salmonella enterica subsp. enterica serovar Kottbus TaxID=224727 RepID=A0A5J0S4T5_SALET|nr:hypothetical protein [Salmonella enterica subsp. enterica serovar Kottbus]EDJ1505031.1 hypothetical protein [Salmonella enterica]EDN4394589.1 hypothetical protein [Salmonella enterica subsp. enterica]EBS1861250.1 hypothetical protein [Salmonella enterica subsp. enterica serovar Kottbus]EBW1731995.1 hypothetical protein [Salmonella enterica subsp. enterica serovar Kottbus]